MSRLFNVSTTYRSAKLFITSAAARYLVVSSGLNYNLDGSIVHDHGDHYQRLIDMRPHLSTQCFLTDENCFQTTAAVSTEFATSKAHADWNEEKITKMALGRTKPKKKTRDILPTAGLSQQASHSKIHQNHPASHRAVE